MVMGESGRTSRCPIISAPSVVVVEISAVAATAPAAAGVATVIVIIRIIPGWCWVDGLHGNLGSGLGCGVESLRAGIVLCPELHSGLHGDLGLLGKAMAAVGGRGAAVAWGRCAI